MGKIILYGLNDLCAFLLIVNIELCVFYCRESHQRSIIRQSSLQKDFVPSISLQINEFFDAFVASPTHQEPT